jgi:hypothetical protein
MNKYDLTGQKFGLLTVISRYGLNNGGKNIEWLCQCVCSKTIVVVGTYLRIGKTRSCGCIKENSIFDFNFSSLTEKDKDRFWSKVAITANPNKCWEWNGTKSHNGYGHLNIRYSCVRAHRMSYFIENNIDPLDKAVLHTCDNRKCVNPKHLKIGSALDNIRDCINKGRFRTLRGSEMWNSKLNESQVLEIRNIYSKRELTINELVRKYSVSYTLIWRILKGQVWKSV